MIDLTIFLIQKLTCLFSSLKIESILSLNLLFKKNQEFKVFMRIG